MVRVRVKVRVVVTVWVRVRLRVRVRFSVKSGLWFLLMSETGVRVALMFVVEVSVAVVDTT